MCMGCAKLTDDITILLDFINKADQDLYQHKREKEARKTLMKEE